MRKIKAMILSSLLFFLLVSLNTSAAGNRLIPDRELFRTIQRNNLELFQGYLKKNANWHATDGRGNTLIHALIAPEMIVLAEPESSPIEGSRGVAGSTQNESISSDSIMTAEFVSPSVSFEDSIEMHMVRGPSGTMNNSLPMRMGIIRRLVTLGVDINQKNDKGETPLLLAVRAVRLEDIPPSQVFFTVKNFRGIYDGIDADLTTFLPFFRLLLNLGADPRLADAEERTPIFYATVELFPLLLQHGAALEDRDKDGLTPFLFAKTKPALALLKLGAEPRATDNKKRNRWHYLEVNLWEELAQKLSELGVNINQQDVEGRTPLLLCCHKEYSKQVNFTQINFLVEHGADISLADKNGQIPLLAATKGNNLKLMEWLLQKGAPVNVRDRYGNSPLLFSRYHKTQVELLLRYKADPNIQDNSGNTILHLLADNGNPETLDSLSLCIRNGAAVNKRNNNGETPLIPAYQRYNTRAMKILLENGADPNISTFGDYSLLDRAELDYNPGRGRKDEIISLLKQHGARRNRSWFDRNPQALLFGYAFLGIIPLLTFLFSLYKPSGYTKKILVTLLGLFVFSLLCHLEVNGVSLLPLILIMTPLPALLMSLSGTRALADRCPPGLGIPLSFLNAAGCMGLTFAILQLLFLTIEDHFGEAFAYVTLFGGGAAAVITLIFAFVVWKTRLAPLKNTDSTTQSDMIQGEPLK